ncbi:hypothetical protein BDZ94DRAFT_1331000 [Collybia nuda]|uniref:Uncharacterized protein n=1 Tax=Collybia nuda TaxID=64659 RepID=A0A9P6CFA9_9AGAR|nr:hypothetical protein BDZ94DRAFT_1331000 [Collybia nuda]
MPFFENTAGPVTINNSQMRDVKGDYHHDDRSTHATNIGSHNSTVHNTRDSHNNSSTAQEGNQTTHHDNVDGRSIAVAWDTGKETYIQPHPTKDAQFPSGNVVVNPERESPHQHLRGNESSGHQNFNSSRGAVNNSEEGRRREGVVGYLSRRPDDMDVDDPGEDMQSTHPPTVPQKFNGNTYLADHQPPSYTA